MNSRERQENAIETRSVNQGDLTEVGRSTRAKKSFKCDAANVWSKAPEKIRTSRNVPNCQKGNLRALQVTAHLGNTFFKFNKVI
jgi:hypothetical protein